MILSSEEVEEIQEEINGLINRTTKELGNELKASTKNVDFNKATLKQKEKILSVIQKIVKEQEDEVAAAERNAAAAEKQRKNNEEAARIREREGQLSIEFDDTMGYAEKATNIAERVMTVTGSLSSLAMA
jgi:paraquat-inducible protein B